MLKNPKNHPKLSIIAHFNRKVNPILLAVLLLSFFTLFILIFSLSQMRTATVEILVTPSTAHISLNHKSYHNGTYRLRAGNYQVSLSSPEFTSQTFTFELKPKQTHKLYAFLEPKDPDSDYYQTHPKDAKLLTTIGDYLAQIDAKTQLDQYPVLEHLPIVFAEYSKDYSTYTEYRIDGGSFKSDNPKLNCPTDFCLKITDVTGNNYQKAIDHLKSLHINPADYHILYEYTPITPLE